MRLKLFWLAVLNIATIILLATLWEFGLEARISSLLGLGYDSGFETSERVRFILTSTSFASIAMIIPALLIVNLIRKILAAEKNALRLAGTDALTGVMNRRSFNAHLAALNAGDAPYTLTLLDITDFKSINDMNGHRQGDATLIALSGLLTTSAGTQSKVFRIGGDEFAIVTPSSQAEQALADAERLCQYAAAIRTGPHTFLSLSAGIASSACTGQADVVRAADLALYEAKQDKISRLARFSPDMELRFRQRERLEQEVVAAVSGHAIVPFLQPLVSLRTGNITGFEILARWITASGQTVSPAEFLPVVERLGLMDSMTVALLQDAVNATRAWPAGLCLSLNITPEQLLRPSLTGCLSRIMQNAGPVMLELEITEQNVMAISDDAREAIRLLKEAGIGVALDDFGTGYSNLSVLLGLGITKIKIDQTFIAGIVTGSEQRKVVETLLVLCQGLNVVITAEGIEDVATLRWLRKRGCDYGQGYLFSRPVPAGQATTLLASANAEALMQDEAVAVNLVRALG
ncbi:bifunctional diguanylate cyclase/phosphodiesterase [Pantoea sp. GD03673]|uniref:putative bifunctional diguanylate cyclase/phosphodiesterase n=1 Tax=Pantoea sp. GD03673 TaxID=2975364 RepID=UPI00244BD84C|nr:bifunctional diguanylate cyclase/phosphodiesterase [Pantoea sp. GD03673]MDH2065688.1 bifunctional diguanylate cyclase/phosphodiesterase [Pantoea sp. GD03673]